MFDKSRLYNHITSRLLMSLMLLGGYYGASTITSHIPTEVKVLPDSATFAIIYCMLVYTIIMIFSVMWIMCCIGDIIDNAIDYHRQQPNRLGYFISLLMALLTMLVSCGFIIYFTVIQPTMIMYQFHYVTWYVITQILWMSIFAWSFRAIHTTRIIFNHELAKEIKNE